MENKAQEFVSANINQKWDWGGLSCNDSVTPEFVSATINQKWDWGGLSCNDSVTSEFVSATINQRWNWERLSLNNFSNSINKEKWDIQIKKCHKDLIIFTWHPRRVVDWCFDNIDLEFMNFYE